MVVPFVGDLGSISFRLRHRASSNVCPYLSSSIDDDDSVRSTSRSREINGHIQSNSTNLAIKGLIAIKAMAVMSQLMNDTDFVQRIVVSYAMT